MHSPQRFSLQSLKRPSSSLTIVSLTMTVQVPTPDSPLKDSVRYHVDFINHNSPMDHRHKRPIHVTCLSCVVSSGCAKVADQAFGASQLHTEVASTRMVHIHRHRDVLKSFEI